MTDNPPEIQERVPLVPSKGQVWRNFFRHAAIALGVLVVSGVVCGGLYEWVRPTDPTPFNICDNLVAGIAASIAGSPSLLLMLYYYEYSYL